ncbi:MAG: 30S ribosomal protein S6 [Chitinivibrionales bacterium]|nr:30S ribosomal protein S6 [Chitinivibrionales bacterium]
MIRPYETMVVYDGTLGEDSLKKEQKAVEDFLREKSEFEAVDVWGKRDLAYEINKKRSGYYCLFLYKSEGGLIAEMEADFRLNASILRFLTVRRDPNKIIDPQKSGRSGDASGEKNERDNRKNERDNQKEE